MAFFPSRFSCGIDGCGAAVTVGFHYLSAYRVAAAAAGARGTEREEPGSARRVHTQNTFPLKRRGDQRGRRRDLKKKGKRKGRKTEREGGRARGREFEKKRKMSSCRLKHRGGATDRGRPGAL